MKLKKILSNLKVVMSILEPDRIRMGSEVQRAYTVLQERVIKEIEKLIVEASNCTGRTMFKINRETVEVKRTIKWIWRTLEEVIGTKTGETDEYAREETDERIKFLESQMENQVMMLAKLEYKKACMEAGK